MADGTLTLRQQLDAAQENTQSVYERNAAAWHRIRNRSLFEKVWLDRFEERLTAKGPLLDLGCGSGAPVANYFLEKGYAITGVDSSQAMIALARANYPAGNWLVEDMTRLSVNEKFTGIYSWDGFFHLTQKQQRALLPQLTCRLTPGGALLLTVGYGDGEVLGTVIGEQVYHASLASSEYEDILTSNGCTDINFKANDEECFGRSVLLATKT
jgi:trans-aconitate methyltransferase